MAIIQNPITNIFTRNPHEFSLFSAKQRGQVNNGQAYRIVFSAIPTPGQIMVINWHGGTVTFTFVAVADDTGENIRTTGVVVATWARDIATKDIQNNFEISKDFIIYSLGTSSVYFQPNNYGQELSFELGSATNAPVTLNNTIAVTPDVIDPDYVLAVRYFIGFYGQNQQVVATEYYTPVLGQVKIRPGDILFDNLDYYLPTVSNRIGDMGTIFPLVHRTWGYEVAEYKKSTNEYFVLERVSGAVAIKGGLKAKHFKTYFNLANTNRLYLFSNFTTKRVVASQIDLVFYFILDDVATANTWAVQKTYDVTFANGTVVQGLAPLTNAGFMSTLANRIYQAIAGWPTALLEATYTTQEIEQIVGVDLVLRAQKNGAPDPSVTRRSYTIHRDSYLDYFLMYHNSFGVPELVRLRAGKEQGIRVEKDEFMHAYTATSTAEARETEQYNSTYRETLELTSGFLPKKEAEALVELFISKEVYLSNAEMTVFKSIDVSAADFMLLSDQEDRLAINFKALGAKTETGFSRD